MLLNDKRSLKAKKNIIASFFIKGVGILTHLLLVPITLNYLNAYEYGIWLALNSILMWINTFDIGLGNGLRNKLSEALAQNKKEIARAYVSTTFFTLILIMLAIFSLFYLFSNVVDWYDILNVEEQKVRNLNEIVIISFALFCITFVFKFIGNVYFALQLPSITNLLTLLGQVLALVVIYGLTLFTEGNLLYVAIAYSLSPALIYILAYPITFLLKYKHLSPSFSLVKKEYLKSLIGLGFQFLFLQLGGLILFASSNIIITQLFGPEEVTPYNIAYRYFTVVPMLFTIIITPMWSAATEAYAQRDIEWIKKSMYKIQQILFLVAFGVILMIVLSQWVYKIWVGDEVQIPFTLSILMGVYVFVITWSLSYSSFLNGLGKLRIQIYNTVTVAVLFIPISLFFGNYLSITGVVLSMLLVNLSGAVLNTIQFNKIVNLKAKGFWAK